MKPILAASIAAFCTWFSPAFAQALADNDIRTLRVGMPAADLPASGYADMVCSDGNAPLASWRQWRDCKPNGAGLRTIAFRYDDTPEHDTVVAGQPVTLALAIRDDGIVQSITMRSAPSGRVFVRKRGVHFGERVMNHYGAAGWTCKDGEPASGEEAVGSLFIRQHCEKTLGSRALVVDRELYRRAGEPQDKFVSQTVFTVSVKSNAS